jgi:hypothetical protein
MEMAVTQTTWYDSWDASNNTGDLGQLVIQSRDADNITNIFSITGAVTSAAGYYKIPVSYVSGDLPSDTAKLSVLFAQAGNVGTSGTSGTSGGINISNNTSGSLLLASGSSSDLNGAKNLKYTGSIFQITGSSTTISSSVDITGSLDVSGSVILSGSFSGSFEGLIDNATTASHALTLSQLATASFADRATTASQADNATTASHIVTASYADAADTASFTSTGDGTFSGSFSGSFQGSGLYTVANFSDNRVITSVDEQNGNAEANLTFDGTTLAVTNNITTTSITGSLSGSLVQGTSGSFTQITGSLSGSLIQGTSGSFTDLTATTFTETSAERFKTNIQSIEPQLDNILKLNPVTFDWIEDEREDIGLIAEQVNEIYPEFVGRNPAGEIQGIKYSKLTTILIKSIQELKQEVETLKAKING